MMKGKSAISSVVSLLLCIWYLTAIVGIDIHTNHHDGDVFVVSLLGRTDCESLHPDDVCHCVEHHCGNCHSDDEDCENEISLITLTGDGSDIVFDFAPDMTGFAEILTPVILEIGFCTKRMTLPFTNPPRQHLKSLCVLRV